MKGEVVNFINFCRVFLSVSTDAKSIKIDKEKVIIKNKVARFSYGSSPSLRTRPRQLPSRPRPRPRQ